MIAQPWLKHYPKEIPSSLKYEAIPLQMYLQRAASRYPTNTAIHFMGKDISYEELYESALKFANYLIAIGIEKGDRVALMLPNCPQSAIGYFGILFSGGIIVPVNPVSTEREIQYQMKDCGAKAILILDLLYPRVSNIMKETMLEHIIVTKISEYLPFPQNIMYPYIQQKEHRLSVQVMHGGFNHLYSEMLKISSVNEIPIAINVEQDLALLQYTEGTTDRPKGVMLTHKNIVSNVTMCRAWFYEARDTEEVILSTLPFFHIFGMMTTLMLSVVTTSKMVLLPKLNAHTTLRTIETQQPTIFPAVPPVYRKLLSHPRVEKFNLTSIQSSFSSSETLPQSIKESFEKMISGNVIEGYGLTETSTITHANFVYKKEQQRKGSIGVPWPNTDSRIVGPHSSEPLENGVIGEIAVKGPQVMTGYWGLQQETEDAFIDGWLLTGDLGYMDEDGYFYVVGRKVDQITVADKKVYPFEIEEVLYKESTIDECVVVGIPHSSGHDIIKAYIVVRTGAHLTEEELDAHCRNYLPNVKLPHLYEFMEVLPKNAVGKILRRLLIRKHNDGIRSSQ